MSALFTQICYGEIMKKLVLFIFLSLMWCNTGFANSLFYGDYKNNLNKKYITDHLKSVESGMSWMQVHSEKFTYCKPDKLLINKDNLRDAIKLGVKNLKSLNFSNQKIDSFPVELIMLIGLNTLFPCS